MLCPCWNLTCILIIVRERVGEEEVVYNLLIPLVIGTEGCVEGTFEN